MYIFLPITKVRGFGLEKGKPLSYRGAVYDMGYIARYKIELLIDESRVEEVINCIMNTAKTGHIGDGKIMVFPVEKVIRIRTGEMDRDAINN
jgi:nitrogen regulatory protein P-II 1